MTAAALYGKHSKIANAAARGLFVPGFDQDDIDQEARLALWNAARSYDPERGATFPTHAWTVVRAHILDLISWSQRDRRRALDSTADYDLSRLPHLHQVSDVAEQHDDLEQLTAAIRALPDFQRHCVIGIAAGLSYAEIGNNPKRIDNALYTARRTLRATPIPAPMRAKHKRGPVTSER